MYIGIWDQNTGNRCGPSTLFQDRMELGKEGFLDALL